MPKKRIPVPSDFARPKPGAYLKKDETKKPVSRDGGSGRTSPKSSGPLRGTGPLKKTGSSEDRPKRPNRTGAAAEARKYSSKPGKSDNVKKSLPVGPAVFKPLKAVADEEKMPLNKYISHCGICSRREAIDLIKEGRVLVNTKVEKEPGYKVLEKDQIQLDGKVILPQRKLVYFLLNKPKDFITTTDDPEGRKTVMDLMKHATDARIFPVGRLDRNTTGLLLLTNDGELTQKLSHPKHKIRKVYQVVLDKALSKTDFEAIAKGVILEDGPAYVDEIAYTNPLNKKEIGIEIHIGRNRIVRRIFEHLQYEVKALDRVIYAGLTKKNLPRGKFRELSQQEVIFLKHFK